MPAFEEDDIRNLEEVLTVVASKARRRGLPKSRETLARKLFEAACAGERNPDRLVSCALNERDGDDDDFFPPTLGRRPPPSGAPIWHLPSLAAA